MEPGDEGRWAGRGGNGVKGEGVLERKWRRELAMGRGWEEWKFGVQGVELVALSNFYVIAM